MALPEELEAYKVGALPSIFYIPDYLSLPQQLQLLNQINVGARTKWKSLKNRRLQNWGGVVHEKGLLLQECQGIMPHQDGPAYFPVVAILSLGSAAVMQFTPHQRLLEMCGDAANMPGMTHEAVSVVLMPGSLLVFKDAAYQDFLHGIDECKEHKVDGRTVNVDKLQPYGAELLHVQVPRDVLDESMVDTDKSSELEHDEQGARKDFLGVVKRNGTRVSLTCRLVTKVHKNLFRI